MGNCISTNPSQKNRNQKKYESSNANSRELQEKQFPDSNFKDFLFFKISGEKLTNQNEGETSHDSSSLIPLIKVPLNSKQVKKIGEYIRPSILINTFIIKNPGIIGKDEQILKLIIRMIENSSSALENLKDFQLILPEVNITDVAIPKIISFIKCLAHLSSLTLYLSIKNLNSNQSKSLMEDFKSMSLQKVTSLSLGMLNSKCSNADFWSPLLEKLKYIPSLDTINLNFSNSIPIESDFPGRVVKSIPPQCTKIGLSFEDCLHLTGQSKLEFVSQFISIHNNFKFLYLNLGSGNLKDIKLSQKCLDIIITKVQNFVFMFDQVMTVNGSSIEQIGRLLNIFNFISFREIVIICDEHDECVSDEALFLFQGLIQQNSNIDSLTIDYSKIQTLNLKPKNSQIKQLCALFCYFFEVPNKRENSQSTSQENILLLNNTFDSSQKLKIRKIHLKFNKIEEFISQDFAKIIISIQTAKSLESLTLSIENGINIGTDQIVQIFSILTELSLLKYINLILNQLPNDAFHQFSERFKSLQVDQLNKYISLQGICSQASEPNLEDIGNSDNRQKDNENSSVFFENKILGQDELSFCRLSNFDFYNSLKNEFQMNVNLLELEISFSNCYEISLPDCKDLAKDLSYLHRLYSLTIDFENEKSQIKDESCNVIFERLENMKSLKKCSVAFNKNSVLTEEAYIFILKKIANISALKELHLAFISCTQMNDPVFRTIGQTLLKLGDLVILSLDCSKNQSVNDKSLSSLCVGIQALHKLSKLNLSFNFVSNITEKGFEYLFGSMQLLGFLEELQLNFQHSKSINHLCLKIILASLNLLSGLKLAILNFSGPNSLQQEDISEFKQRISASNNIQVHFD